MGVQKCIVSNCGRATKTFALPSDAQLRTVWLTRAGFMGNITGNLKICPKHFSPLCLKQDGKGLGLVKGAVPSLHLPDYAAVGDSTDNFWFPPQAPLQPNVRTPEKIRDILASAPLGQKSLTPPTPTALKVQIPARVYGRRRQLFKDFETAIVPQPSTSQAVDEIPDVPAGPSKGLESVSVLNKKKRMTLRMLKSVLHENREAKKCKQETISTIVKLLEERGNLLDYLGNSNMVFLQFLGTQLRNFKLSPRGRRFSLDDKLLALAIYKRSARTYRFLSKFFSLPSRKSLSNVLNRVPFFPGFSPRIFEHLKTSVGKPQEEDRNCILMFDEISLHPRLRYNQRYDYIEGLVDLGPGRRRIQFADHALVFIAKGVRTAWKQPVFFGFCRGTTSTVDLVHCIKSVIGQLQAIGLVVIATVCDQGSTNVAAINSLKKSKVEGPILFTVGGQEIVHIYDPPHLLKGVRNGLLTKDLRFSMDGSDRVASWSHILQFYIIDQQQGPFVQCFKLTDEHVLPSRIRKMKVKHASQVFSHTLASAMHARADMSRRHTLDPADPGFIEPEAVDTAALLLFFDNLFDSVNGLSRDSPPGKPLRRVVSESSGHEAFWISALPVISSMSYIADIKHPTRSHTPSLNNWISTVHGFLYLRKKLLSFMEYFSPRYFNQDPVENFFSQIQSHAHGDTNCSAFINAYKALMVSGLTSTHSVGANCEEDVSTGLLGSLKRLLEEEEEEIECPEVEGSISSNNVPVALVEDFASDYVAGAVTKRFLQKYPCNFCKELLWSSSQELPEHLRLRQYEGRHLVNPSEITTFVVNQITISIMEILPSIIHKYGLKRTLFEELRNKKYKFLLCNNHDTFEKQKDLLNILINIVVFNYVKKINRVLKGVDERLKDSDVLFKMAYKQSKKYKNKSA